MIHLGKPGRRPRYRTWFSLWMDYKRLTIGRICQILVVNPATVVRWRKGGVMRRHMASLIRAIYPEAPVHRNGGEVLKLSDKLPIHSRTVPFYRFLMSKLGYINTEKTPEQIWPIALEQARLCYKERDPGQATYITPADRRFLEQLKARESAMPPSQPASNRVADMLPPAD